MSRPREFCHESTPTAMSPSRATIVGPSGDSVNVPLCDNASLPTRRMNLRITMTTHSRTTPRCSPSPNRANGGTLIGSRPVIATDPNTARAAACCDA